MDPDTVVLVHGLGGSRLDMWPISRTLKQHGLEVINWGYNSVGRRIEELARNLETELSDLDKRMGTHRFHLVTHSMGGIIARTVFAHRNLNNLGRVVMLAPPNQGSDVARKLIPYLGWLAPSLQQLADTPESYVNRLPNSLQQNEIEFGIVEASKDRVVPTGHTRLDGYKDFAHVDGHHGILTWYPQTIRLVESFLSSGSFSDALSPAPVGTAN